MSFAVLMQQICVIFLEILLGFFGFKRGLITDRDSKFLSNLTMTVFMPFSVLSCATSGGGRETAAQWAVCFGILFCFYIVSTLVCRVIARSMGFAWGRTAVLVGTAAMPNCSFVGIPLVSAVLGSEKGMLIASAAMASYNLWFFTYVTGLFKKEKKNLRSLLTTGNVSTVVLIVMLVLGIRLPAPLESLCSSVGACITPVALLIVGVMLARCNPKELIVSPFLYLVTVLRGLIFPGLLLLALLVLKLNPVLSMGMLVLASCPSGNLSAVLAMQTGTEENLCGQAVAQSTLFMLVTVPVMMLLGMNCFPI